MPLQEIFISTFVMNWLLSFNMFTISGESLSQWVFFPEKESYLWYLSFTWLKLRSPTSNLRLKINGLLSDPFILKLGVRLSGSRSVMLYIIATEVFAL